MVSVSSTTVRTLTEVLTNENSETEQMFSDSIKVIYEVINLTKSDSENSEDEVILKKRILEEKVNIDVNNTCREILLSIIYKNMHEN